MRETNRKIFICEICKKPNDLSDGRLLYRIVAKGSLSGSITFENYVLICYECLPLNNEEQEE